MSPAIEALLILLLILLNGLLAMAEIAIVSARKVRLQQRADAGDPRSKQALELAEDPSDFLATVQIGITLVGILAGAFGGASLTDEIGALIARVPALAPYSQGLALSLVVLVITFLSLVLGELAPKQVGLRNPEGIAARVAGPMRLLSRVSAPVVALLTWATDLVLRLTGGRKSDEPPITEDEIKVLLEQGTQAGVFEESEQDMVESIFRLTDRRVSTLMVPRLEVQWLDVNDTVAVNYAKIAVSDHSRFPVGRDSLDNLLGVVRAKDLLAGAPAGELLPIEPHVLPPVVVPESMPAVKVLETFRSERRHMAIVIDEFGSVQGLVTTLDMLTAIVGDIPVPGSAAAPEIVRRDDGSYLVDGMLPVDEFKDFFELSRLPGEEPVNFQTLGGFVVSQLGRIPAAGDRFTWGDWQFEVIDMDARRVDKVLLIPAAGLETNE